MKRWALAAPAVVAIALSWPLVGLGYFWDDYFFLTRAQRGLAACVEYVKGAAFWRPLTQGLYFYPLAHAGDTGALVAHLVNLGLLAASAWLLARLVARHAGTRAGILAGLFFAGLSAAPSLVGWASGAQDLAAIFFFLVALSLHDADRTGWALPFLALALLSKEAIAVAVPALVLWDLLVGRKPARFVGPLLAFGSLALAWAILHPGIRLLLSGRIDSDPRSYVGSQNAAMVALEARRYLRALVNFPVTGLRTPWPAGLLPYAIAAWAVGVAALYAADLRPRADARGAPAPSRGLTLRRALLFALLLSIPGLLLPSIVIRRWAAYFVCIPALGTSVFFAVLVAEMPLAIVSVVLAGYLALGAWSRGVEDPSGALLTERSFRTGEHAARNVESQFRRFHPELPRGAHLLVSVAASGMAGIHGTLHDGQAPRIWYDDPTIRVLDPERRLGGASHEMLFRITAERTLVEIDPDVPSFRSTGVTPNLGEVRMVIGTYARGLAATGEPDRAVAMLERIARAEADRLTASYDLRLAAMVEFARRDTVRAESLLAAAAPLPRGFALDGVARVLAQPTRSPMLDEQAYRAFGIPPGDPEGLRYWMAMFYGSEYFAQAREMALRLQEIAPGDRESAEVLMKLARFPAKTPREP